MAGEQLATKVSLEVGDGAGTEVFAAVPGIVGIPGFPALEYPEIEVTALDSTGAEFITGLGDGGEVTFTLNMRKAASGGGWLAVQAQLQGYHGDGALHNFKAKIGSPVTKVHAFAAFVKTFRLGAASANSAITAEVVLRVSGAVTIS